MLWTTSCGGGPLFARQYTHTCTRLCIGTSIIACLLCFGSSCVSLLTNPNDHDRAAIKGFVPAVQYLSKAMIKKNVDIDCRDSEGDTPLILAAQEGHVKAVAKLVELKADFNLAGSVCVDSIVKLRC